MKKLIYIFLVIQTLCLKAQTKLADIQIVLENIKAQEDLWNKGSIPGFMEYYLKSDSLMFIGKSGITYGWQKTLANYVKRYPNKNTMGYLKFEIIATKQLSSESIYLVGKWHIEREIPTGGYFTLLWKKINNKWFIVCDHTS